MRTSKKDRTPKKKGIEHSYWVKSHEETDLFIPRAHCDDQNEANLLPRVFTHKCILIAESRAKEGTSVPNYLQANEQYVFMHPDTMQLCDFTVAQLIAIHSPSLPLNQTAVGKLLPSNQLHPSKVVLNDTIMRNCQINSGEFVQLVLHDTNPPVAETVELKPCQPIGFPVSTEFTSYLLSQLDGSVVSKGQEVRVQYLGSIHWLLVTSVKLSTANTGSCHDTSLSLDMSNMSLDVDCSMDSVDISHDSILTAECLAGYDFFIITHHSHIIIQTMFSSDVPRITLDSIKGMDKQVKLLYEIVVIPLSAPDAFRSRGIDLPRGLLLYGVKGVGKSLLAQAVADKSGARVISIASQQALLCMDTFLAKASGSGCVVVVIEALDVVCPCLEPGSSEAHRQAVTTMIDMFDAIHKTMNYAVVMATTNKLDAVEPSLRTPGRFDKEIEITVPNPLERKQVLKFCLNTVPHDLNEVDITNVADAAHGYVRGDLVQLCKEAQCGALSRTLQHSKWKESLLDSFSVNSVDLWTALRKTKPTAMREVTIEVPKVLWSDIGGQEDIKQKFKESVEWPLKHPEAFTEINIDPPKGVLLYGPPGCSKTMIARALATESGLNFIAVKGPELFSKYVGDSERAVRQVFDRARATAPSIIFFDEIDALAVQRKSEGARVADRVLAQLLTEMGGVEGLKDVLVVAATNRPDMIDEALLRPGRIDRILYVPLPDADTRRKIFELRLKKSLIADDVVLDDLVALTDGYSGAEVVALCQEAGMNVLRENINSRCIHQYHFLRALTVVKPKTNQDLLALYERYNSN